MLDPPIGGVDAAEKALPPVEAGLNEKPEKVEVPAPNAGAVELDPPLLPKLKDGGAAVEPEPAEFALPKLKVGLLLAVEDGALPNAKPVVAPMPGEDEFPKENIPGVEPLADAVPSLALSALAEGADVGDDPNEKPTLELKGFGVPLPKEKAAAACFGDEPVPAVGAEPEELVVFAFKDDEAEAGRLLPSLLIEEAAFPDPKLTLFAAGVAVDVPKENPAKGFGGPPAGFSEPEFSFFPDSTRPC